MNIIFEGMDREGKACEYQLVLSQIPQQGHRVELGGHLWLVVRHTWYLEGEETVKIGLAWVCDV